VIKVLYDARWVGPHGIGRFAGELLGRLPSMIPFQSARRPWHPLDPVLLTGSLCFHRPRLFFSPGYNSPVPYFGAFVFTLHDLNHLRVPANSNPAKRAYYEHIIRPACHRAAFVLTVSEYSKREITDWAKVKEEKVINVGNGVGMPFTAAGPKHDPGYPYLLYVGSRKPNKNIPRLLKAYSMSGVGKDVRLVLSGQADERTLKQAEQLGLNGSVMFSDSFADEDLSSVYRGAVGFVFPSLYEGFGLPPLEAMACGVPVLSSNVCSIPEVLGNAGLLVDPCDIEAIADGIRRLVQDSTLRGDLRQRGLLRAKLFSWEETAKKTWQVLQSATAVA
jgi:glycosyltransferase involved in cell wall biosynthesis